jgi:hypothetical protein
MSPRHRCARSRSGYTNLSVVGCRRHGPVSVVGAPRRSYGYAFGAPPRIQSHGACNETRQTCAELP